MDQFGAVWEMICCIRGGGNQYCGTNCILQYWGTLFVIDMYVMLDEFYHQSSGLGLCNPASKDCRSSQEKSLLDQAY